MCIKPSSLLSRRHRNVFRLLFVKQCYEAIKSKQCFAKIALSFIELSKSDVN